MLFQDTVSNNLSKKVFTLHLLSFLSFDTSKIKINSLVEFFSQPCWGKRLKTFMLRTLIFKNANLSSL